MNNTSTNISGRASGIKEKVDGIVSNLGGWFFFFSIIYVILLFKAVTYDSISNHVFFGIYSLLITTYILSRFLLAYLHKPIPVDLTYEPSVTFVVPAKDEEDNIEETIRRFAEVEYPKEKIEVVAINDGSTDSTLERMYSVAHEIRDSVGRIEVVNFQKNRGKRYGMAEGAKRAKNDVIIFIDSDSFIDPQSVRHMVKYFADPSVGAVSGHTDVWNRDTNLLTQMQAIRYYIAFSVYKAAESIFGVVTCCPGCCSAYRRRYVMEFIDEWLHQRFLGVQCTYGDDRSLTNFMIRKYRAVYSPMAKAHTVVPDTFQKYMLQQQRWKRSWIRETFIAATFMWRKNLVAASSFYAYIFLAFISPIVFFRAVVWYPVVHDGWPVVYLTGLFLMLFLHGLYYRIHVGARAWILAVGSFWLNTVILMWQLPWAALTLRDTRWGTR
ncbi:MAG: glycosyltransferase family 2 protein [Patescibacteria group bacterium]|nr:glycosyltransferase family 2 protein [Patescibacteria group bacterium]